MTDEAGRSQERDDSTTLGLAADLRRALLIFLRILRAGRGALHLKRAMPLVEEMDALLTALLTTYGEVHLRVGVDGLYLLKEKVLETSPREDPAIFRLFQHGVRQISFHPGCSRDELVGLADVLTADLSALENVEEDITTLLASREFTSIHFVVVETFSESGGAATDSDRRSGDVAAIMAAAVRKTLSELPASASGTQSGSGNSIRFWAADVKFLEGADLPQLIAALPKSAAGAPSTPSDDPEIGAFRQEIGRALTRSFKWLPRAVVTVILAADDSELEPLCMMLADELLDTARQHGLVSISREVEKLAVWVDRAAGTPKGEALRKATFSQRMRTLANLVLKQDTESGAAAALAIYRSVPESDIQAALKEVCAAPASATRSRALSVLVRRGATGVAAAQELLATAEREAAVAMLRSVRNAPLSDAILALHHSGLVNADVTVRVQALTWFARQGGDHAAGVLGAALRDEQQQVRLAALYLLTHVQRGIGRALIRSWFDGPEFEKLAMNDKRSGALVLASIGGDAVVPHLREILGRMNIMMRARVDEMRAAAAAALAFVGDPQSLLEFPKLSQARLSGEALMAETAAIQQAHAEGRQPYGDPIEMLEESARQLGIFESRESLRRSDPYVGRVSVELPYNPVAADGSTRSAVVDPGVAPGTSLSRVDSVSGSFSPSLLSPTAMALPADAPRSRPSSPDPTVVSRSEPLGPPQAATTVARPTGVMEPALDRSVIDELLGSYSFDPIPPMPGAGNARGDRG